MALIPATVEGSDKLHLATSGKTGTLCGKDYNNLPLATDEHADWCKSCADAGDKLWTEEQETNAKAAADYQKYLEESDTEPGKRFERKETKSSKATKSSAAESTKTPSETK